jgi:hypothetical protein
VCATRLRPAPHPESLSSSDIISRPGGCRDSMLVVLFGAVRLETELDNASKSAQRNQVAVVRRAGAFGESALVWDSTEGVRDKFCTREWGATALEPTVVLELPRRRCAHARVDRRAPRPHATCPAVAPPRGAAAASVAGAWVRERCVQWQRSRSDVRTKAWSAKLNLKRGGAQAAAAARRARGARAVAPRRPRHGLGGALAAARVPGVPRAPGREGLTPPPSPTRTKWTRRVPHPVLIGHAASLAPY